MKELVSAIERFMLAGGQDAHKFGDHDATFKQKQLYWSLIREEFTELRLAATDIQEVDAICDLIWVLIGYGISCGFDIVGAMDEVLRSNMSKVDPSTGKILKRNDGKILKPPTYSPPALEKFIP